MQKSAITQVTAAAFYGLAVWVCGPPTLQHWRAVGAYVAPFNQLVSSACHRGGLLVASGSDHVPRW